MIILDTHIWLWWVTESDRLTPSMTQFLVRNEGRLGVSVISCWEIGLLVAKGRLELNLPPAQWIEQSLLKYRIRLLELTSQIAVDATHLPGSFHRDPADQIIVATARFHQTELATADKLILAYPHVRCIRP